MTTTDHVCRWAAGDLLGLTLHWTLMRWRGGQNVNMTVDNYSCGILSQSSTNVALAINHTAWTGMIPAVM